MTHLVELASVLILVLFGALEWKAGRLPRFAREASAVALGGWLAEDLCIRLFGFYGYTSGWTLTVDRVPVLIAVIWPFVIFSALSLARAISPGRHVAILGAAIVLFDAMLIEPVAVRAGLWTWIEPGLWQVPLIGVVGWGVFAWVVMELIERGWTLAIPLVAPLISNALLVALWWGAFRWGPRDELELPIKLLVPAAISIAALGWLRARRGTVGPMVMGPRVVAAVLFVALVAACGDGWLGGYVMLFSAPYLWLTGLRQQPEPTTDRV